MNLNLNPNNQNVANFNAMVAANPVPQLNFGNAGQGLGQNPQQFNELGLANMPPLGPNAAPVNLAALNNDALINQIANTQYAAAAIAPFEERLLPNDFENMIQMEDAIAPGTLMVDFQGEYGFGHIFRLSDFLAFPQFNGLRRNPATNIIIQPNELIIYRISPAQLNNNNMNNLQGGKRRKTGRGRKTGRDRKTGRKTGRGRGRKSRRRLN